MKRTGKYAYVDNIPCTQGWSVNRRSSVQRYQASCVPGASGATPGNTDETGSLNGLGYVPPMPTGDDFAFIGVSSNKPTQLLNYRGTVLITETTLRIPVAAGTPITWSSNFGVQGELAEYTIGDFEDPSRTAAASGKYGKISVETGAHGSNSFTDVDRVQDITLTFRRPASTSVNDGTTERDAGNLEVDLSFMLHNDKRLEPIYIPNDVARVKVFVTDTLFFMLDSIMWAGLSNYRVDRGANPPPIISYTVNGMWTALRSDVPHLGHILLPSTDEFYPGETST